MTDVTQSRPPSPKPTNIRADALGSSHATEDPQSDNQGFFALEDSDPSIGSSTNESTNVCGAGLSHDVLMDGVTSIRVEYLIVG